MLVECPNVRPIRSGPAALVIRDLLEQAKETLFREFAERRSKARFPFFCRASLELEPSNRRIFSIFTRDVSRTGIGLLHCMPLPPQTAYVTIYPENRAPLVLLVRIVWCRPNEDGWHLSGAEFVELAAGNQNCATWQFCGQPDGSKPAE